MAFTGTLDKCKACDKTVYVVDLMTLEGVPYHKTCFRCSHCKGYLQMSTYSWMDGVLYCKTHFEQLFKESGNFSKNFQSGKTERGEHVCLSSFMIYIIDTDKFNLSNRLLLHSFFAICYRIGLLANFHPCFLEPKTSVQLARKRCTRWKRLPWKVNATTRHVLGAPTEAVL
ncbi:LIM domain-containing protein PLIM2b-like isoform X2 [Hibiscus syriacus]|uniref:LIM domain-containing protein PLIM2b-like isoform X2 n=1 Tax=Hibiscus syriacus TaxID=106335 RepID=UPI001923440D|nr:LIM domain-containing protein PLIM2b-like isoform X2 [Hibiscus syriacus]